MSISESAAAVFSVYVTMRDGVRLAVDVFLPPGAIAGRPVPSVVQFTRYWRSYRWAETPSAGSGFSEQQAWLQRGFARVNVDARGSGASFGHRETEYSADEVKDQQEILSWIAEQPWSNGAIGTLGISYAGNAAELAQVGNHPSLRAVIPRFTDFDWYEFILFPGGLRNVAFGPDWGRFIGALDAGVPILPVEVPGAVLPLGVKPVDGDEHLHLLNAALAEHAANHDFSAIQMLEFRDEAGSDASANIADLSTELVAGARPAQHWASWLDSGTAAGALARFRTLTTVPMELIIGSWNHGAAQDGDPFLPDGESRTPDSAALFERMADFMARHTGDVAPAERVIHYKTLNERAGSDPWRQSAEWPPQGVVAKRWWLQPGRKLGAQPSEEGGVDTYAVNYEHGTGRFTRWTTSMSGPVLYPERSAADALLLHYTSEPLEQDLRLCGDALVTLRLSSTHDDAAVIVYLEHVAPDGRVRYVTEGQLRARSRHVSARPPRYVSAGPHRRFERAEAAPMVPGEVTELRFALLPTAVLFHAGDRLRIAIAGADIDSFERVPASGMPVWQVQLDSYIDLPVQILAEESHS